MTKNRRPAAILVTTHLRAGLLSAVEKKKDDAANGTIRNFGG